MCACLVMIQTSFITPNGQPDRSFLYNERCSGRAHRDKGQVSSPTGPTLAPL